MKTIAPGSTIGILGGGQLGKMLAQAASQLGYSTHIYCPEKESPAFQVCDTYTIASYQDQDALMEFGKKCDVITFEFENIPTKYLESLLEFAPIHPNPQLLEKSQNRILEKNFATKCGVKTVHFKEINTLKDIREISSLSENKKVLLKTCEGGYDGKGHTLLESNKDFTQALEKIKKTKTIGESFVDFKWEISVLVARNENGSMETFPVSLNNHKDSILQSTTVPTNLDEKILKKAQDSAIKLAEESKLVGLLAVEFFVTQNDEVIFNEMAPRTHNSFHWTLDGCETNQFEQQIRAICGLPLGSVEITSPIKMVNLIGEDIESWERILSIPGAKVYIYGKKSTQPGRKMGHVNFIRRM